MVACHSELRLFFLDHEVVQLFLLREFITETQSVIEQAETNHDRTVVGRLFQGNCQFVVVVPDFFFFAPDRLPGFIEAGSTGVLYPETVIQIRFLIQCIHVLALLELKVDGGIRIFFLQFQAQMAGFDHFFLFITQVINR